MARKARRRLRDLRIEAVALVSAGDNPGATVELAKNEPKYEPPVPTVVSDIEKDITVSDTTWRQITAYALEWGNRPELAGLVAKTFGGGCVPAASERTRITKSETLFRKSDVEAYVQMLGGDRIWQDFPAIYDLWQAAPSDEVVAKEDAPRSAAQEISDEIDVIVERQAEATGETFEKEYVRYMATEKGQRHQAFYQESLEATQAVYARQGQRVLSRAEFQKQYDADTESEKARQWGNYYNKRYQA